MPVLVKSIPLIHNTGRQAKLLRMGCTKALPSVSKDALSCKQENPHSSCWQHSYVCSPEYHSPSLREGTHCWLMSNFVSTRVPQAILPSYFPAPWSPVCTCMMLFVHRWRNLHLPFLNFRRFLQPVSPAWQGSMTLWCISQLSQFCVICW